MSYGISTTDDYKTDIKTDNNCPPLTDTISDISWVTGQQANIFAATCWDGNLRLFEVIQGAYGSSIQSKLQLKVNSPLTACCWSADNSALYIGCGDGSIKAVDINTSNIVDVGKQNAGISGLHYIPNQNVVIASAYENNIGFWKMGNNGPVFSMDVGNKVFCSDFQNYLYTAGCSN